MYGGTRVSHTGSRNRRAGARRAREANTAPASGSAMTRAAKAHIMSVTQSKEVIANLSRNNSNRFVLEESLVRAPSEEWARRGGGTRRTRRSPVTPRPATRPPRVSPCALSLRGGGVGARPPATCSCALHFCASPTPRRAPRSAHAARKPGTQRAATRARAR